MAVPYPAILKPPQWQIQRSQPSGVEQSDLSAKPRQQRISYDNAVTYSLTFRFTKGQARIFRQWINEKVAGGRQWFTIGLPTAAGFETKTVRFTKAGRPQMTGLRSADILDYTATVVSRD